MKLDRLKSQLQTSGLQTKDFPLFQVIDTLITEAKSIEDTLAKFPSGFTDPLGVTHGGTGTALKFTKGSVVFAGDFGIYTQNNPNFFWDDTNKRLGIRTNAPANAFDLVDSVAGPLVLRIKNTYAAGAANVHASIIVENSSSYGQLFKAGVGYAGYKNIQANDLGFFNITGGNISTLNDSGNINFAAGGASSPQLTITSSLITLSALFLDNSFGVHQFAAGGTSFNTLSIVNATAGVGNGASLVIGTDLINNFVIQAYSSTYTPSGYAFANGGSLANSGVGGLSFAQTGTGDIRFYTTGANVLRMKIATGGIITTTSPFRTNNSTIGSLATSTGTTFASGFCVQSAGLDSFLEILYDGTSFKISSTYQTSEGYKPITFYTSETERIRILTTGEVVTLYSLLVNGALANFSNGLDIQGAGANVADFQNNGGATANIYISPSRTLNGGSFWDRWIFGAGQITTDDFGIGNSDRSFTAFQILGGATGGLVKFPYTKGISVTGPFGCNAATPQTPVASGGALAAYVTGAFGLDSNAHMQSLFNLVVSMRAALVANGIMS